MGCCMSAQEVQDPKDDSHVKKNYKRPKWKSEQPMTMEELQAKREEFWDTQPAYGGNKVVWDTLKGAVAADHDITKILLEAAELIVTRDDMTEIYDPTGNRYELPPFVLSEPTNLVNSSRPTSTAAVELTAQ
mmetsp:Transcript_13955/g.39511  ORF Transcript_13955/g.39511 Transcript_13955/m.39511 type:complete len:132 (-) Transcript_13955:21-416(-)